MRPSPALGILVRLMLDPGLRDSVGARARADVKKHFTTERLIFDYLAMFKAEAVPKTEVFPAGDGPSGRSL